MSLPSTLRRAPSLRALVLALMVPLAGCSRSKIEPTRDRAPAARNTSAFTLAATSPSASRTCERRIRRLLVEHIDEQSREARERRLEILTSVPAEPVLFVREPRHDARARLGVRAHALALTKSKQPAELLDRLLPALAANPELSRPVLLREGYLYAETPELARALVSRVEPRHLFSEPRIWIQRGQRLGWARRADDGRYLWTDGPERGHAVKLVLFDRVGVGGVPPAALHRDLRELQYRLHFEAARVRHLSEARLVLDLKYGEHWVPTLLASAGARLEVECEAPQWGEESAVAEARMRASRRERGLRAVRRWLLAELAGAGAARTGETRDAGTQPTWSATLATLLRSREQARSAVPGFERETQPDDHQSGDIVIASGRRLFVYEVDPLSGAPIAAVVLSPRPSLRPWGAPAVGERIRPSLSWLEAHVPALEDPLLVPPPIVARRRAD